MIGAENIACITLGVMVNADKFVGLSATVVKICVEFVEDRNKCAGVDALMVASVDIEVGGTKGVSNEACGIDVEERISM